MTERTAEQTKSENIQAMGTELGEVYSALWQELARLHDKWLQYVTLFGTNPERIKLLNTVAPRITYTIQKSLWQDIVLHIARLADSAETGRGKTAKKNLSFDRLAKILMASTDATNVTPHLDKVKECSSFAIDWRHRVHAHRDLDIATGKSCKPLEAASRANMKAALAAMVEFMNAVASSYRLSITLFEVDGSGSRADVERLLITLKNGLTHQEQLIEKVKSGELTWKDVHKPV